MGIILNKLVDTDCILGVWEICEDFDTLISQVTLTDSEMVTLMGFQSAQRKLEWLSVRVLIGTVLNKPCSIVYNADHKPFIADMSHHISISHSKNLTSVLASKTKKVGIDLEYMSHQIHNVSHKFMNEKEYITQESTLERLHLYIHWCAKEALYKICDKQDINFKQNLTIGRFDVAHEGKLTGYVDNIHGHEQFDLHYFLIDDYVTVWCNK